MAVTERETRQIDEANASGRPAVVFIHGLWLLPSSWDRWSALFQEAGYAALTPSWPDDPETVEEARANPQVFAEKTVGQVADHVAEVVGKLTGKPASRWRKNSGRAVAKATGSDANTVRETVAASIATRRFTTPEEGATLVAMLASERTANITGVNYVIDGGLIKTT